MGSHKLEQYRQLSDERREAISAYVDAHFPADGTAGELPLCAPMEFQRALLGRVANFVEAKPFLGCEILELNDGEKWHARKHFNQRWKKLASMVTDQAVAREYGRTLAIPLVDRLEDENKEVIQGKLAYQLVLDKKVEPEIASEFLKRNADDKAEFNTASATILAREYLLRWRAGQADDKVIDMARALLENSANQGDPQACHMLANERVGDDYLCQDHDARRQYHKWAVRCGHIPATNIDDEIQGYAREEEDHRQDWQHDEDEGDLRRANDSIRRYAPKADAGDPEAQYMLACALIEKQNLLARVSDTEIDESEIHRAISLLKQASPYEPRANYALVSVEEHGTQRAIELLRNAVFPPEPQIPDFRALAPLAEKLTEAGDIHAAEKLLRFAIQKKANGERLIGNVELELAKFLDEYHLELGSDLSEVRELYLAIAPKAYEPWSSLRAAVMCLRGEGGPLDMDKARECFEQARKKSYGSSKVRLYAELGYTLGWRGIEASTSAPELLTRLLAMNKFQADNSAPFGIGDVEALLNLNKEFHLFAEMTTNLISGPRGDHSIDFRYVDAIGYKHQTDYRGLTLALSNFLLLRGGEDVYINWMRENQYLERYSMVGNYVLGGLAGSGRLPPSYTKHARRYFEQAEKIARIIADTIPLGPNNLRAYEFFSWLRHQAHYGLQRIRDHEADAVRELTQRDMLSYLTHTLNNVFSGRPEAARQAIRILGSGLYENNAGYTAINNIASMMSTFLFAQQLVSTFKTYVADPDSLRKNWESDGEGDSSITAVLALSLRQTLSQLVFSSNQLDTLDRLLIDKSSDAVRNARKSFMDEMIPLDVSATNAQIVFNWVNNFIGGIHITIDSASDLHFHGNSTRFTFFFSCFSELIFNALKYSDTTQPIGVAWEKLGEHYVFRCENAWSEESISNRQGSDKGLVFLDRLTQMLGATLVKQTVDNRFIAEIRFPENLFKEAS